MPRKAVIELHYLPCIDYFSALSSYEEVCIETWEHYPKQTYRNRCLIYNGQQTMAFSVAVKKPSGKVASREIEIEHKHHTLKMHARAIQSVYGKAPWFEMIGPDILHILCNGHRYLSEMNMEILSLCLKFLKIKPKLSFTDVYYPVQTYQESGIDDLRDKIHPKKTTIFKKIPYRSIFGKEFVENLSIIDLLFSEGPLAKNFIGMEKKKASQ